MQPSRQNAPDATEAFFDALEARGHDPGLERASGTVRFEIANGRGRARRWLVSLDNGDVSVSHANGPADCVVQADRAIFDRLATGRANPLAAMLRGAMQATGDITLLVAFQRLFPDPPASKS